MNDPANKDQSLISQYREAKRSARRAYYTAAGLIIVFSALNVFYIIFAGKSFLENEIPETATHFSGYMATVANRHAPQVSSAAQKVLPIYADEIIGSVKEELPSIEKALETQGKELRSHIEERGMEISDLSSRLVRRIEKQLTSEIEQTIGRKLSEKERREFAVSFSAQLNNKLLQAMEGPFEEHKNVSEELEKEIRRLVLLEPDLNRKVDPLEALGILLELGGVKLQLARTTAQ